MAGQFINAGVKRLPVFDCQVPSVYTYAAARRPSWPCPGESITPRDGLPSGGAGAGCRHPG